VHHHPNEPVQNHLEHNLENVSYGVWHEINPLNLLPKTQKYYLLAIFLVRGVFLSDFQALGVNCGEMGFKNPIFVLIQREQS
jgi:hypothetical protein